MTRAALCRALKSDKAGTGSVVSRMHKQLKSVPRRIHIADYTHYDEGSFIAYPRALYALGDLPDAKRPPRQSRKKIVKRCREARKARVSSVFEFAMPRRAREAHRKAIKASTTVEGNHAKETHPQQG